MNVRGQGRAQNTTGERLRINLSHREIVGKRVERKPSVTLNFSLSVFIPGE